MFARNHLDNITRLNFYYKSVSAQINGGNACKEEDVPVSSLRRARETSREAEGMRRLYSFVQIEKSWSLDTKGLSPGMHCLIIPHEIQCYSEHRTDREVVVYCVSGGTVVGVADSWSK